MNLVEFDINSHETLFKACEVLEFAKCTENDIRYDSVDNTLDIFFNRGYLEDPTQMKTKSLFIFFQKQEFPVVRCHFHLSGILKCEIHLDGRKSDGYEFEECLGKDNKYTCLFSDGLQIMFELESPMRGYFKDLHPIEGKTHEVFKLKGKKN